MAYPSIRIAAGSYDEFIENTVEDDVGSGPYRARDFSLAPKRRFFIKHVDATAAERATFDAYYLANKSLSFTIVWPVDGVTYTCYFSKPAPKRVSNGFTYNIDVTLREA